MWALARRRWLLDQLQHEMRTQAQARKIHLATLRRVSLKRCGEQEQGIEGYRGQSRVCVGHEKHAAEGQRGIGARAGARGQAGQAGTYAMLLPCRKAAGVTSSGDWNRRSG